MKRLLAYLLAAMMLPMLGVWNAAEAAKPRDTTCGGAAQLADVPFGTCRGGAVLLPVGDQVLGGERWS